MHQRAIGLGGQGGHTGQVKHRQIFRVRAGNRADRTELTDAVGGADGPDTANAGISVGRVGGVEFVAGANPVDVGMRNDGVLYGEREITRHTEDVGDTDVLEPAEDILDDGWCGGHGISSS